jgi:hypothetical protein
MVYIVGVDHLVQYDGPLAPALIAEFRIFLVARARELGCGMLAEEFSQEALRVCGASESTAGLAAADAGVPHRFCDLEERDMRRLGIPYFGEIREAVERDLGCPPGGGGDPVLRRKIREEALRIDRSHWSARELFWMQRLEDVLDRDILFICGHEHASRFRVLLLGNGRAAEVVEPFWRAELFREYDDPGRIGDGG